jgi:hypothetical protein
MSFPSQSAQRTATQRQLARVRQQEQASLQAGAQPLQSYGRVGPPQVAYRCRSKTEQLAQHPHSCTAVGCTTKHPLQQNLPSASSTADHVPYCVTQPCITHMVAW